MEITIDTKSDNGADITLVFEVTAELDHVDHDFGTRAIRCFVAQELRVYEYGCEVHSELQNEKYFNAYRKEAEDMAEEMYYD